MGFLMSPNFSGMGFFAHAPQSSRCPRKPSTSITNERQWTLSPFNITFRPRDHTFSGYHMLFWSIRLVYRILTMSLGRYPFPSSHWLAKGQGSFASDAFRGSLIFVLLNCLSDSYISFFSFSLLSSSVVSSSHPIK